MTTRHAVPLAVLAAALAGGCFNSHNPGYFPYYVPGGPVVPSHGKPAFGYFRDFDPKACKVEVTPTDATAPLGSQVVVVATVRDKDGQPRRSRRVEWMLDGPGSIVEVDEAGFYAGRGYKHDNTYAVSHTGYAAHTITRGNDDPKDDVDVGAGQTFCVVSCPVPGETVLTAYAPGVFDWEKGRAVAKVVWGEGRFLFPPPATVRTGTEHALTTTVARFEQDGPAPPNYHVRYRLVDAADESTVLVSNGGRGDATARDAEAATDADGKATVRLVQTSPQKGKTRVAVEVVKLPAGGTGPGTVVGRRETLIEWATPELKLDVTAPPVSAPSAPFPATVTLANTSPVDSKDARVRVTLSDGATLERSEPPPTRQDGGALVFDLPGAKAGKAQTVAMQVRPAKTGSVTVSAEAVTADALQARRDAVTRIDAGKLSVLVEPPAAGVVGEPTPIRVAVTNAGQTAAANVNVFASFDEALKHASGKNPVELEVGTLDPGQTKTFDLPLTAALTGRYSVQATATADGKVSASSGRVALDVRRAELKAVVAGPKLVYLNQEFRWTVAVANAGDIAAKNVSVRATLPPEVRLKDAGDGTVTAGSTVEWKAGTLGAGEQRTFTLTLDALRLTGAATLSVATVADGDSAALQAKAEGAVAVIGTPAVVLELATPSGPVEAGRRGTFEIRLRNQGTVSARQLEVTTFAPPELRVVRGVSPDRADARLDPDGKVSFPALDELRPGQAVTFTVEVEAVRAGDARFRAEVKAAHLRTPLREEQALRVTAGR